MSPQRTRTSKVFHDSFRAQTIFFILSSSLQRTMNSTLFVLYEILRIIVTLSILKPGGLFGLGYIFSMSDQQKLLI
jgi:hypothetical protein